MAEIKSLEQKRAEHAWRFVSQYEGGIPDKIASLVRKLPAMIITSGLGQTVAFCLSKDEGKTVIDNIAGHLLEVTGVKDITCGNDLLKKITGSNHETYIVLSKETLKYATWLKRLVEAKTED